LPSKARTLDYLPTCFYQPKNVANRHTGLKQKIAYPIFVKLHRVLLNPGNQVVNPVDYEVTIPPAVDDLGAEPG
jgi:hypothetical protein